ncbi:outer membrane lipid asymmetry maintenance protein MlaD [Glacieibacterium sp.]|uniref:outer membrane lipid asymmetry maintenance protein MlaD n=1 Tax=Glacieibacterium sp. TaxID=2860237 RepID=UPI003AFF8787
MRALLKDNFIEALIGLLVLVVAVGFVVFAYQRTAAGGGANGYKLAARFANVTGVSTGTDVRVSGMKVGTVTGQRLDAKSFQAVLDLSIDPAVKLPIDSSAAITSEGILGGSYISLTPGGDPKLLKAGDEIDDTQGATDLMSLIGGYINRTGSSESAAPTAPAPATGATPAAK